MGITNDVAILPRSNAMLMDVREDEFSRIRSRYLEDNVNDNVLNIGSHSILPNGNNNDFPQQWKNLLDSVYIGHGVKRTLINLLLSGNVGLYKDVLITDDTTGLNKIAKDWAIDTEIADWLDSWDFESWLDEAATDLIYFENAWSAMLRNKGARIGQKPNIAAIKHYGVEAMRLDYVPVNSAHKYAYKGDWTQTQMEDIRQFPLFEPQNPFKHAVSFSFQFMPTITSRGYGRPPEIGAVQMLRVLSLLPNFHYGNLTQKGFKWLIYIDTSYYESVCRKNSWDAKSVEFANWKKEYIEQIDNFLSSADAAKVQTRFTLDFMRDKHNPSIEQKSVIIEKLEDDSKMLSEVGLNLHSTYSLAFTSAMGISPKLAKQHLANHALSGSDLKEEYEVHIRTATPRMRAKLLAPINQAIRANWPEKRLKIGFMDSALITNANPKTITTPSDAIQ